jgi:hypothetical protein
VIGSRGRFVAQSALTAANVLILLFSTGRLIAAQETSAPAASATLSVRWFRMQAIPLPPSSKLAALAQPHWTSWENGSPHQWPRLLSIHAAQTDSTADTTAPSMLGSYRIMSGTIQFRPQFPLQPGISYKAILHREQLPDAKETGAAPISATFTVPSRGSNQPTLVTQIYPSADILPENLLKFYLHFSAPMSRGHIYDYIHLREESGKEVELPFLEIDEELWNPTLTRLTLFIDPGRIKRGVRPLEEIGPALQAGKRYALVIDDAWKDGFGHSLGKSFQKLFTVGPPDREPPDPAQWKVQAPAKDAPLTITFPEPLDQALAERVIQVARQSGERVDGRATLADHEQEWKFLPTRPWDRGSYNVVVQTTIEDLAGNNIGKPFEVDLVEPAQVRFVNRSIKLPFTVR